MKLSPRLDAIVSLIDDNCIVADIGTDHGLLPISLVSMGKIKKAYAIDNKSDPLLSAQENIKQSGLSSVSTILSDGLSLLPNDCNCLVLAGLGAGTIIQILENDKNKLSSISSIIVQANVGTDLIRRWANANQFQIDSEVCIEDNNIIYDILKIKPGFEIMSPDQLLFGPIFLRNIDELFIRKWKSYLAHFQKILAEIPTENPKKAHYEDLIKRINKTIQR